MDSTALTHLSTHLDVNAYKLRTGKSPSSFPIRPESTGKPCFVEFLGDQPALSISCSFATSRSPLKIGYQIFPNGTSPAANGKTVYIENVQPTTPSEQIMAALQRGIKTLAATPQLAMATVHLP